MVWAGANWWPSGNDFEKLFGQGGAVLLRSRAWALVCTLVQSHELPPFYLPILIYFSHSFFTENRGLVMILQKRVSSTIAASSMKSSVFVR